MSFSIPADRPWGEGRRRGRGRRVDPDAASGPRPGRLMNESDPPAGPSERDGRGRRRSGRGHRHPPGFDAAFGRGFGFGPAGFGSGGGRARRGDVRAAILSLLTQEPMHGYQLMQEIARRSEGMWRPSAGSVYPALALLEDEGLIRPDVRPSASEDEGGRKVFTLTEAGRAYTAEHARELEAPWDEVTGGAHQSAAEIIDLVRQVGFAAMQVVHSGDSAAVTSARAVLDRARRSLYLVLAGEAVTPPPDKPPPDQPSPAS